MVFNSTGQLKQRLFCSKINSCSIRSYCSFFFQNTESWIQSSTDSFARHTSADTIPQLTVPAVHSAAWNKGWDFWESVQWGWRPVQEYTEDKGATSSSPLEKVDNNEEPEGGIAQQGNQTFKLGPVPFSKKNFAEYDPTIQLSHAWYHFFSLGTQGKRNEEPSPVLKIGLFK